MTVCRFLGKSLFIAALGIGLALFPVVSASEVSDNNGEAIDVAALLLSQSDWESGMVELLNRPDEHFAAVYGRIRGFCLQQRFYEGGLLAVSLGAAMADDARFEKLLSLFDPGHLREKGFPPSDRNAPAAVAVMGILKRIHSPLLPGAWTPQQIALLLSFENDSRLIRLVVRYLSVHKDNDIIEEITDNYHRYRSLRHLFLVRSLVESGSAEMDSLRVLIGSAIEHNDTLPSSVVITYVNHASERDELILKAILHILKDDPPIVGFGSERRWRVEPILKSITERHGDIPDTWYAALAQYSEELGLTHQQPAEDD